MRRVCKLDARLPAHIVISGFIISAEAVGGSGMVISKGERDAGTIMIVIVRRGENATLYERMPQLDGVRRFVMTKQQTPENYIEFNEYLLRRGNQDPDGWILELDVPDPDKFVKDIVN